MSSLILGWDGARPSKAKLRSGIARELKPAQLLGEILAQGEDLKIPAEHFWM